MKTKEAIMKSKILLAAVGVLTLTLGISGLVHAFSTPPSWAGMSMLAVSCDGGVLDVADEVTVPNFAFDTLATGAPNYSVKVLGGFDPEQPWKVLNGRGFSRVLGWWDANSKKTDGSALKDKIPATYGAGACIWIEVISQSEGLKTYNAVGKFGVNADNSQTVDPEAHGYAGIFGTDGSPTKWKWDYGMDHNVYTVPWVGMAAGQEYSATYEVYVGDSEGNKIGPSTTETWTWRAPATVPSLLDEGDGQIYDRDLNVTWYQTSSDKLWTAGSVDKMITTYLAGLSVNGIGGWRLPRANSGDIKGGINDTGELGHLYYVALGNTLSGGLQQTGPFIGLQAGPYWTETIAVAGSMNEYYVLDFSTGLWDSDCGMEGMSDGAYVLAVHDGNTAVPDEIAPSDGTLGTQFSIRSSTPLGTKGKVLVGSAAAKVIEWNTTDITCQISKTMLAGDYAVTVLPKGAPKKTPPIVFSPGFTVQPPLVKSINTASGPAGTRVAITGRFFGSKKGKVHVGTKNAKVLSWNMDPGGESQVEIAIPKGLTPGADYEVKMIVKSVGEGTCPDLFHME
jgi:hypothetical protein